MFVSKRFLYTETSDSVGAFILKSSSLQVCGSPRCWIHTHTRLSAQNSLRNNTPKHNIPGLTSSFTRKGRRRPKQGVTLFTYLFLVLLWNSVLWSACSGLSQPSYAKTKNVWFWRDTNGGKGPRIFCSLHSLHLEIIKRSGPS